MRYVALGWISFLLIAATAKADWVEVSSDHFVIYSEQGPNDMERFANRLERFHAAMAHVFGTQQAKPSPSNRVRIFVVDGSSDVRKVTGINDPFARGVYFARAGSSVAVVPKIRRGTRHELSGETILYHEYAHHFMYGLTARAYPRWFVEGFAEFFASTRIKADGSVTLGTPPLFRAQELVFAPDVPILTLLSYNGSTRKSGYDSFYGQSWGLFHYLQMAPERQGQMAKYQQLLASGHGAIGAAEGAFGNLTQLNEDLEAYMRRRKLSAMVVDASALQIGPIQVRKLRAGESEMMPVFMESKVGVSDEEAAKLVPLARKIAGRHPNDPAVLSALAEAEYDAGNLDEAIAAADRALALDPQQINAHIQKGYALADKVESGALPKEAWVEVRNQFIKANRVENDHPVPLVHFYSSYIKQGEPPTKNAIAGLEWAMQLAPFDESLRWLVAQQMIKDERLTEAAQTLMPLAYSPHAGEHTESALTLLKDVEARLGVSSDETAATVSPQGE